MTKKKSQKMATIKDLKTAKFEPMEIDLELLKTNEQWLESCQHDIVVMRMATITLTRSKAQLAEGMKELDADGFEAMTGALNSLAEQYEGFASILRTAELRFLVAAASFCER